MKFLFTSLLSGRREEQRQGDLIPGEAKAVRDEVQTAGMINNVWSGLRDKHRKASKFRLIFRLTHNI